MLLLLKQRLTLLVFLTLLFSEFTYAQREKVLPRVNGRRQMELDKVLKEKTERERNHAHKIAKEKGWKIVERSKDGRIRTLTKIDVFGIPIYEESDDNAIAAATTNTNKLYSGGSLGLNLSGNTIPDGAIGLFESGTPLLSHVEFGNRIELKVSPSPSSHATHVAGTIMAAGINPAAKGMAYQLPKLLAFNTSISDMNAYSPQMLLSNHSYGPTGGWYKQDDGRWFYFGQYNAAEDYKFGYYDEDTQYWDDICANAPYYLPVKSAGNFRTRTGPAIGADYWGYNANGNMVNLGPRPSGISSNNAYNTITNYGNAKNILTVGATHPSLNGGQNPSDIIIANFSSWGPTDDGRIKPDLVANGIDLVSTDYTNNTAYLKSSGTSMSTPNATGTLTLLQELFNQKYSSFMRSATLKALVLSTTSKTGTSPGPNYIFGWGLLNAEKAAKAILDNGTASLINELTLSPGTEKRVEVIASGNAPLVATICWTDPAATAIPVSQALNNTTLRLVNDLDLRGTDQNTTFSPWVLDPSNPSATATKGDNFRDNVEQVYIENPTAGKTYTFTVTHKNGLKNNEAQPFSIIITGAGGTAYCTPNVQQNASVSINNIKFANLNQTSATNNTYTDLTQNIINVIEDTTYPISINTTAATNTNLIVKIYADWNNDGSFNNNNELLLTSNTFTSNNTFNTSASIPANVSANTLTRLRVVVKQTNNSNDIEACGQNAVVYDYSIRLTKRNAKNAQKAITGYTAGLTFTKGIEISAAQPTKGAYVEKPNQYGTLSFVAGSGIFGSVDNPYALSANLANPLNIEFDQNGNLFVTESSNPGKIRAIKTGTNEVITIADTYPNNHFTFTGINGLAIYGEKIFVVSESAKDIKYANIPTDISTPFTFKTITLPETFSIVVTDLAVDSTSLTTKPIFYILDNKNSIKRVELNLETNVATLLTNITIPNGSPTLNNVNQFKVMANKDIYVANRGRNIIQKYTLNGTSYSVANITGVASNVRPTDDNFVYNSPMLNNPLDVAIGEQNKIYISEYNGTRIRVYDPSSPDKLLTVIGQNLGAISEDGSVGYEARGDGHFGLIYKEGFVYFAQRVGRRITKIDVSSGKFPYTISPSLPSGLVFNNYTGEITGTPANTSPSTNYTVTTYNNDGVAVATANFTIAIQATLPVSLVSFDAKKQTDGNVQISWRTATETNNSSFTLQKSLDGYNFNTLVEKRALGQTGGVYSYIDNKLAKGNNYYKLIQTDIDGTQTDLGTKVVNGGLSENAWHVYPNPSNGSVIKIKFDNQQPKIKNIKIFNVTGALVYSKDVILHAETLLLPNKQLASGVYIVDIDGMGNKKLIVQ